MKTPSLWNKLALMALVLVASACAKNELPETDEGKKGYYVTMTVNDEPIQFKSGLTASLSSPPNQDIDYQQFSLTIAGTGAIKGKNALLLNCFVYDTWQTNKKYINTFEPDETTGSADKQDQISLTYLDDAVASQYEYILNDTFETGSAHVILEEITSTSIKGTFRGVMSSALLPYMTPLGNTVELVHPLVIEGEFYAPR